MEGTPAGWYDDPEQPGQQRWWDGNAWTDQRAPAAAAAPPPTEAPPTPPTPPTPPAAGAAQPVPPVPPPGAPAPTKGSRRGLWIVLTVIVVIVVLAIAAIVAASVLGGDSATDVVEKNLPGALEDNYRTQGLDVGVSKAECGSISGDDGPFTTTCTITIVGLDQPLQATVFGNVDGSTVTVEDANSDQVILDEKLAATQAQPVIDTVNPAVSITSCTLSAPVVVVEEGMTFTCRTDSNETVTFTVSGGQLEITSVS